MGGVAAGGRNSSPTHSFLPLLFPLLLPSFPPSPVTQLTQPTSNWLSTDLATALRCSPPPLISTTPPLTSTTLPLTSTTPPFTSTTPLVIFTLIYSSTPQFIHLTIPKSTLLHSIFQPVSMSVCFSMFVFFFFNVCHCLRLSVFVFHNTSLCLLPPPHTSHGGPGRGYFPRRWIA